MAPNFSSKIASLILEGWSWWWDGLTQHITIKVLSTLLVAVFVISWYAWLIKKSTKSIPSLPPGPQGLPLLGNLLSVEPELHRYFAKLSQIYGPIIKLKLGSKICIVISSASLAKQVLKDQDANFANRDPPAVALPFTFGGVDVIWSAYGPQWRKSRKVFTSELMSKKGLDASYTLRRQEVIEMVKDVYGKLGSPINIGDLAFVTVLNVTMSMLWGASLHGKERSSVGAQFRQLVVEIVELLGAPNVSDLFPVIAPFDLQGLLSRMKKLLDSFDRIFESLIDNRIKASTACGEDVNEDKGSKDFLQFLLELEQQGDDKSSLSINQIKALLMNIVAAATDTTTTTIEWAMAEVLQHPEIMRKACEELEEVVGNDNIVEESHLDKLHYLNATLKETMRLHPPLPFLVPHSPGVTCTLSGYTIPKGSRIFLNIWEIQRNSEAWENPLEFRPDRFLKDSEKGDYHGKNFNFLTFGSGRRICAGIPMAEKLLPYMLATLLHSFRWNLPAGTELDLSDKFGIVLKKRTPLIVIPTAKSSTPDITTIKY